MTPSAWGLLAAYSAVLALLSWPLGRYIAFVAEGRWGFADRVERRLYRLCGIDPEQEMDWLQYAMAVLLFSTIGLLVVYALQRLQPWLPLNPQGLPGVSPESAFNTATSFATNTNWQGYAGESTMSALTQMLGLGVQNFLSAACGIAVALALIRGFTRHDAGSIGNFWVDLTRITLWVLLPLSLAMALFLVQQGVVQNFDADRSAAALEGMNATQTLPMGPAASQIAIKQLGTNGGGFFNANSAHPYENPTPLSGFVELLAILLIPAALCFTFGHLVADRRQGWTLFAAMAVLFLAATVAMTAFEQQGNPRLATLPVDQAASALQAGGNMEGKETRFGIAASALWAAATTAASNGSVNSMHDSYTPLGGLVAMLDMQLGEVVFGGVGSGLYGMLVFAILAVFVAGLMIGRTPEYLGKKIEAHEMKMMSIVILVPPLVVLLGTALAVSTEAGRGAVANSGPHAFSEILYAFTSAGNNNGSAFAGLSADAPFYNVALAIAMWLGRFGVIVPVLAIAGSLAAKKRLSVTVGTLPTHGPMFVVLLIGTVLLIGLLNHLPALALGPVVEHLMLRP